MKSKAGARTRPLRLQALEPRLCLDNQPPAVMVPIGELLAEEDVPFAYELAAHFADPDAGDVLRFEATAEAPGRKGDRVEPYLAGLDDPVQVIDPDDGTGRLFVVERSGRIQIVHRAEEDVVPPRQEPILASLAATGAAITWRTDEAAAGLVEYGSSDQLGSATQLEHQAGLDHRAILPDLQPETTYYYRVRSRDAAGNETISEIRTLTTQSEAPAGETLYNGITLPQAWPPERSLSQEHEVAPYLIAPPAAINIDVGRQLFVDDFLIADSTLVRRQHRPEFYEGNPILAPGGGGDNRNWAMPFSDGIWFDPADNLFKMWYMGSVGAMVSYAYSTDGIHWVRPELATSPNGTNAVVQIGGARDSSTVWLDPYETDPSRRYKLFAYTPPQQLSIWYSPDGIVWSKQSHTLYSASDRSTVFYNPFRNVWVTSMRDQMRLPATPERESYTSRLRYYRESPDLVSWTPAATHASFWTGPDVLDPPYYRDGENPELYNLDAVAYESVLVGMFSWFHPGQGYDNYDEPGPVLVELGVGFSRDGFHWERPTRGSGEEAFISASNLPHTWNGFNTQSAGGGFLVVGDELWFYFSARDQPKPNNGVTSTGLAKLRRDGFYSLDAGPAEGALTTRPLQFSGSHLFVNVDNPQGELRAEILDAAGQVIGPFSRENSAPVSVDKTLQELVWAGAEDLSSLAGQTVQIRFYLTNGSLYSFWVSPTPDGASHGYTAAGGPGFTGPRDTVGSQGYTPSSNASPDQLRPAPATESPPHLAPTPLLDLGAVVIPGVERGLHSLALHPQFAQPGAPGQGKLYVSYDAAATQGGDHDLVVEEHQISATDANRVDPALRRELLRISVPYATNLGGGLAFGPDGLLYITTGDGGGLGDPLGNAQSLSSLLGKVLRIDVQGSDGLGGQYGIPADNPFVTQVGARSEIFALGFRQPGRPTFAPSAAGSRLFVIDRGQTLRDEVNLVVSAGNYGWPFQEGTQPLGAGSPPGLRDPIGEYAHDGLAKGAAEGVVYVGGAYSAWEGRYLFADGAGTLLTLEEDPTAGWHLLGGGSLFAQAPPLPQRVTAVQADAAGQLYLTTHDRLWRIGSNQNGGLPDWLTLDPQTGQLSGTPTNEDVGPLPISLTVRDAAGDFVTAQFTLSVANVNDPPLLPRVQPLDGAIEDAPFTISFAALALAAEDRDPDGDALQFRVESVTVGALHKGGVPVTPGQTLLGPGEFLVWTPPGDLSGLAEAFRIVAWDGQAASTAPAPVSVVLAPGNDPPLLTTVADLTGAAENAPFRMTYALLAAAADEQDPEGDLLKFRIEAVLSGALTKGGLPVVPQGTLWGPGEVLEWSPPAGAQGTLPAFRVVAWDGQTASLGSATVSIRIGAQWANSVIAFSSQYSAGDWSAAQALGPPNVPAYGDHVRAWAPRTPNSSGEFLTVGFARAAAATGVIVRESFGNGFVSQIELRNQATGAFETVWAGVDPTPPAELGDFRVDFAPRTYLVDAVRISLNTNRFSNWEEIDAVALISEPPAPGPEANVRGNNLPIADGDSTPSAADHTDFGTVALATGPVQRTFSIRNDGNAPLRLAGEPRVRIVGPHAGDFVLAGQPPPELAAGAAFDLQVTFLPGAEGLRSASIQFASDDADEGLYDFAIQGHGVLAPTVSTQWAASVVSFSSQYSTSSWSAAQALGPPNVPAYGDHVSAWAPRLMDAGVERLAVAFAAPTYASAVIVRESFGNGFVAQVEVRSAESGGWETVWAGLDPTLKGSAANFVIEFPQRSYLVDAARITIDTARGLGAWEEIDAVGLVGGPLSDPAPEANVLGNGLTIANGDASPRSDDLTDFGVAATAGGAVERAFTLQNAGRLPLQVSGTPRVIIEGPHAADFQVLAEPAAEIAPGGASVFRLVFDPSAAGLRSAVVRILTNDADESPYTFAIQGTGVTVSATQWADRVIAVSSQYSTGNWSAQRALGPPDVTRYGDEPNAWAPLYKNGTTEFLTVGFATPVAASGVIVRETFGNGFVTKVETRNQSNGQFEIVWQGTDPSLPGSPADFRIEFPARTYLADAVRVTVNTSHSPGAWEEIDAIALLSAASPPPAMAQSLAVVLSPSAAEDPPWEPASPEASSMPDVALAARLVWDQQLDQRVRLRREDAVLAAVFALVDRW